MSSQTKTLGRSAAQQENLGARGIHHLVFVTEDMKTTVDFYTRVLRMPLVHAMRVPPGLGTGDNNRGNPPYEEIRHYFFDMGHDSLLAFFEVPHGAEPQAKRDAVGGMQHCAFAVKTGQFEALMARLRREGISYSGPFEVMPGLQSIYFCDPNNIRLEACYQPAAGEHPTVVQGVLQTRGEASDELMDLAGDATWVEEATAAMPDRR